MIIAEHTGAKPTSNVALSTAHAFTIKASAKAFKILSGFYSDTMASIPRELGANAWDAMVAAKNTDKKFIVHAPNTLEPWFSIRDFGTGLTKDQVYNIYTQYFNSTKTSDNESDGCMGLGSKTPLNYTNNFSVESFKDGQRDIYTCFIDSDMVPKLMHVHSEATTEANGLFIKFAVKAQDIVAFQSKIRDVYSSFRVKPEIVGAKIEFPAVAFHFQCNEWGFRKTNNVNRGWGYSNGNQNKVYMGNYCYPIDASAAMNSPFYNALSSDEKNKVHRVLHYGSFDFYFSIGDLEVAPNKEQLQYDSTNKTQDAICKRAICVYDSLQKSIIDKAPVPKTVWEACRMTYTFNSNNSDFVHITSILSIKMPVLLNGKTWDDSQLTVNSVRKAVFPLKDKEKFSDVYGGDVDMYSASYDSTTFFRSSNPHFPQHCVADHTAVALPVFFVNRSGVAGRIERIKHYLDVTYSGKPMPEMYYIIDKTTAGDAAARICKYLGIDDKNIIDCDALPKPPKIPRSGPSATVSLKDIKYTNASENDVTGSIYWSLENNVTLDPNVLNYYVDLHGSSVMNPLGKDGDTVTDEIIKCMMHYLVSTKVITVNQKVYGINRSNCAVLKSGQWKNIVDVAKDAVAKDTKLAGIAGKIQFFATNRHQYNNFSEVISAIIGGNALLDKRIISLSESLKKEVNAMTQDSRSSDYRTKSAGYKDVAEFFGVKPLAYDPVKSYTELNDIITNDYESILFDVSSYDVYNKQALIVKAMNAMYRLAQFEAAKRGTAAP